MMSEQQGYLCVGGPLDGKMHGPEKGCAAFVVPLTRPMPVALDFSVEVLPQASAQVDYVTYVRCPIGTPDGLVVFWIPEGTRPIDMLNDLVRGYNPCVAASILEYAKSLEKRIDDLEDEV